ncbi:hypothetical protein BS330_22585 [Amycolatopsis keratiniphila subsp. nogabecina]|nr:hypothetical protein BS330_22585 [Amycolatopsis keratiniphila subsp. nogabecina]
MTQEELSDRTGISVRSLSEMERGRVRNPQRRTVELLIDGLGLGEEEARELTDAARAGRRMMAKAVKPGPPDRPQTGTCCELPPTLTELTGRATELQVLDGFARDAIASCRLQIAVVHGLPGAGKTALAVDAGHRLAGEFPHGCLFLDLRGMDPDPLSPDRAVQRLLRALGVDERNSPTDPEDRLSVYRSLLRDRTLLLILDNAADEAQVRPLLATSNGSMVLVTSRNTLAGLDVRHRIALGLLDDARAVELLGLVAGAGRVAAESDAARRVAALCGGVPLALVIAGNRLASRPQWTIAHLANQLADERRRLSVLSAGDLQVRAAFETSYHHLDPASARMFHRLALVPGPETSVELAAVISGEPTEIAETTLDRLAEVSLLGFSGTCGRYTSHDLLRAFARERLELGENAEDVRAALERMRNWLLAVATKAALYFDHDRTVVTVAIDGPDPVYDRGSAGRWLAREEANWRCALRSAAAQGEHRKVLALATAMHWYSDLRGSGALWREVFDAGAKAARALGDVRAAAEQLNYLSWALYALCGQPYEALTAHHLAVEAAAEAGDLQAEAWAWYYRAPIERRLNSAREAVLHGRRAVELFERAEYPNGYYLALSLLGAMLHAAGEFDEAVAVNRRSVAHYRGEQPGPGNDELLAMVLTRLAVSLTASGEVPAALELLDEAEALFRDHGVTIGVARARQARGDALIRAGRLAEATDQLLAALDEVRGSQPKIEILLKLAELSDGCGEPAQAREHRLRALAECTRYDTPAVRITARKLIAELGITDPS